MTVEELVKELGLSPTNSYSDKNRHVIVTTLPSCHMVQLTILPRVLYVHKIISSGRGLGVCCRASVF